MTESEFNASINRHSHDLMSHAMRYTRDEDDAADLVQETMIKAIRFRANYKEDTNLKGWLFTILKNTFLNTYSKEQKKKTLVVQDDEISSKHLSYSASSNLAEGSFVMNDIQKALAQLPELYRSPFISYFEGYKYHEISDRTGLPLGTVKTRIHMARALLKKYLKIYRLSGNAFRDMPQDNSDLPQPGLH